MSPLLAKRLRECRIDMMLSQREVGECIGANQEDISRWEKGVVQPRLDRAVQLARLFGVSLDWLAGRVE